MLLQNLGPRRATKKPLIILCAIAGTFLLGRRLETPFASLESNLDLTSTKFSRIDPLFYDIFHSEKHQDEDRLHIPGSRRRSREVLAIVDKGQWTGQPFDEHHYREDGLVEVNPEGPHPIFELVARAQEEWDRKLQTASTTLPQAVKEYRRRYNRLPPKGFDDWWTYVVEHNVQLPDEYDQIHRDLEPFWGMDPNDLQKLQRDWEAHEDTFTIGKDSYDDPLSVKNHSIPNGDTSRTGLAKGAYEMIELLEDVEHLLPPFRAVFSPHDNPNLPTDCELKRQALRAAQAGMYIDINNPPEAKLNGWLASCSPHSPARNEDINWGGAPNTSNVKTFIYNHRTSMDPCQHPSHLLLHGQFISHRKGPVPHRFMVPQFSYSPTMLHHDITPAMPINWIEDILPRSHDPEWEERWDARLQWRGSNTGIWHADDTRWDLAQRARLVRWGGDGELELGAPDRNLSVLMPVDENRKVGKPIEVRKAQWAPAMADVAFAGEQINCTPELCRKLDKIFEYRKRHDTGTAGKYRYYIDVDGNGWSSRFKRLITSNALVFKSTIYPEWYTDHIAPWLHYIPIQIDLSDLWDALVFFRGDPAGNGSHEAMAKKIAKDGREWSKTFWRKEDMVAYNFRLFLEYSRVMSPERGSMSFDLLASESRIWRYAVRHSGKEKIHGGALYLRSEDDD
ncbi:hypothetical protein BDN70DRAFT_998858 [Pholiota conissans]|uniref:Glycosyl transferase CAP10 domain-containing protein n=1 Tax=Pholiota conissans TaxID=109636 RepID=A0A9P6CS45_9AGAR|nr:hypothetical protein BDN70DRAFT_998858 [Pholiota conissans]